jgi:hypothetical protein
MVYVRYLRAPTSRSDSSETTEQGVWEEQVITKR